MPTARPSIAASVIVSSLSDHAELASVMPRTPKPTPRRAVRSGRPAAISEPKVSASTRTATARPAISPTGGSASRSAAEPLYSTCRPASLAVAAAACRAAVCVSLICSRGSEKSTRVNTTFPSPETAEEAYGSLAVATPGTRPMAVTARSTAALPAPESRVWPAGAANTTVPDASSLSAPGVRDWIRSLAFCDSVPGMLNPPVKLPPKLTARPTMTPNAASQEARTVRRRRTEKAPRR